MKGLDLVILLFTAFLVAKGIWKGFVKEIAGIVAVLLAVIVSFLYHEPATAYFGSKFEFDYLPVATYVILFVAVYAAVMLLGNLIDKILKTIFLGRNQPNSRRCLWCGKIGTVANDFDLRIFYR